MESSYGSDHTTETDWSRRLWVYPALAILAAMPYLLSGSLYSDFVFDDIKLVRDNVAIRDLSASLEFFDITSERWKDETVRVNYRPLRFLSYAIDYQLTRWFFGDFDADTPPVFFFHLTNLVLHALNTLLVLLLGRRLLGSSLAALGLALLFALHPIQTEVVIYISGRRDVLSMFFFLISMCLFLGRPHRKGRVLFSTQDVDDVSWLALFTVPIFFVCGLLSKEMVITLPAVLILIDVLRRARPRPRRLLVHGLLVMISVGFVCLKVGNSALIARPLGGDLLSTFLTAPRYVLRYLFLMLAPVSQSIDYSFDAVPVSSGLWTTWTTLPAILAAGMILGVGLWSLFRGRRPYLALGVLYFLGTLTPVLQFVPIPERFAERFLYLPGLGVLILLSRGFELWHGVQPRAARWAAVAVSGLLFLSSYSRCRDWQSPLTLWASAVDAQPACARAHIGYGDALRNRGRLTEAVGAYTRAIEILQADPQGLETEPLRRGHLLQARNFRADALTRLGVNDSERYRRAIEDYRWLLKQFDVEGTPVGDSQRYFVLHYHLGQCYRALGKNEAAATAFRTLIEKARKVEELQPGQLSFVRAAHYYLGKLHLAANELDLGVQELEAAYKISLENGTVQDRFNLVGELVDALILEKDYSRATKYLDSVIEEMGDDPERKHLLFRRAKILDRRGRVDAAARVLEESLEIDPDFGAALLSLAGIESNRGDLERAIKLYERVLKLAPGNREAERGLRSVEIRQALAREPHSEQEERESQSLLDGLIERGLQHFEKGEYFAAKDLFERAADAEPTSANRTRRSRAVALLGSVAEKLKKYDIAESYYRAALEVDAENNQALLHLADLILMHRKEKELALEYYSEYIRGFSGEELGEPHAYFNLAVLLQETNPEEAKVYFETARRAGYDNATVDNRLGYLHAELKEWQEALKHFEAFLSQPVDSEEKARVRRFVYSTVLPNLPGGEVLRPEKEETSGTE